VRKWFRQNNKNSYSIAALMPLLRADLAPGPRAGIMLYSFATPQAGEVYHEVNQAREAGLDALFIAGGPHPSALPEEALEYFDYVVIGEGEETLPELIDAIETGRGAASVRGIAYRRGEEAIYTGDRPPVDLDCYPPFSSILAPIEITRGCPWGCAYCQTPRLFGRCMRHRSIPVISRFARRHKDIRFTSPNSLAYGSDGRRPRLEKVSALLEALRGQKKPIYFGTFPSEVRPDFVSDEALEIITRHCANRSISLGGQSGSPAVLERIGRGHGRQEIESACEIILEHGLIPQVDHIRPADGVCRGSKDVPGPGQMDRGKRREGAGAPVHAPARNSSLGGDPLSPLQRCRGSAGQPGSERAPVRQLGLEVKLPERLAVFVLQLISYYHLIGQHLDLPYRL